MNWKLALRVGITSLPSERKTLIWSAAQQLSALLHSNTTQQLKAPRAKHNIPLRLWMIVELLWPAIKHNQPSDFYKTRKLSSRLPFWLESLLPPEMLGYSPIDTTKTTRQQGANMTKALCDPVWQNTLPHTDLTGGKRSPPVSIIISWWPVWSTLPSPVASGLFAPLVLSQDLFIYLFIFTEVKSKNTTDFLV